MGAERAVQRAETDRRAQLSEQPDSPCRHLDFYAQVVDFCHFHDIYTCQIWHIQFISTSTAAVNFPIPRAWQIAGIHFYE